MCEPLTQAPLDTCQIICNTGMVCTNQPHKPDNHTNHFSFSVLHFFTQTIPSYKPFIISLNTNKIICNTEKGWSVWRDGLCEGMVCGHTNQIICNSGMAYTNHPHKPDNQTNTLSFSVLHCFTQTIPSHKPSLHISHLITYYLVCVKGSLCERMFVSRDSPCITYYPVCVKGYYIRFVGRDGLCEGLVCVKGCNTENDKWFVWLSGLCGWFVWNIPVIFSLIHPFTETR